jgi:GDP-L-fucose synthase
MSSISAFPEIKSRDINENDLHVGEVNKYNFGYNSSKRISSDLCESYVLDYKRNYRVLFLGNLYGEHATFKLDSNRLNSIIFQIYSSKQTGENLTLYGTGEDQRAFTYVKDLNDFIPKFFAKREIKSCIFSSSEVFSVREIAEKVSKVINFKGRVQFSGEITNNQKKKVASVEYLSKSFPDFRYTPFEEGLEKTIAWFLNSILR